MNPQQRYARDLAEPRFQADPLQACAVAHTQRLYDQLVNTAPPKPGLLGRLFNTKPALIPGLYFSGGTGRGKTYLIDSFYQCLPFDAKRRVHFHRFMLEMHEWLSALPRSPDPLQVIGAELAKRYRVLCLDEFHVHDIGDAMIMAGLLQAIFERGLTLVATSNIPIIELYKNGLQRASFLPAITLLKQHLVEVDLQVGTDYRLQHMSRANVYLLVEDDESASMLQPRFEDIVPSTPHYDVSLRINHRNIPVVAMADDVVWFDFQVLCNTPRAASDYIEIATQFHSLVLGHIPVLGEGQDDVAKRFIHLVDALYDHRVKLIASAEVAPEELYTGRRLAFAFKRTASRLIEMTSHEYLARPHVA
ncbi:MAG: cell division protein ZapE [Proteobacteria bacterium]|jgi:cell division protein ZapE|nr:cell division protein ZapE [Pseudomonadota bacterium]